MRTAIIFFLLFSLAFSEERSLRLTVGSDWYPYNFTTDSGITGMDIVLAEQIFAEAGFAFHVDKVP